MFWSLCTLCMHFNAHSKNRRNVVQFLSLLVSKEVCVDFTVVYPSVSFKEESLKDMFFQGLWSLKIGISNEENTNSTIFELKDILTHLHCTDAYTSKNVLKRGQNIIDCTIAGVASSNTS